MHWYRIPIFVHKVFFSHLLAKFNAQYGKLEVFEVQQFIFYKKIYTFHIPKILQYNFLKNYFEKLAISKNWRQLIMKTSVNRWLLATLGFRVPPPQSIFYPPPPPFIENIPLFKKIICFLGLRSRASLSISALSGRRGRCAHAYGICAHSIVSVKKNI